MYSQIITRARMIQQTAFIWISSGSSLQMNCNLPQTVMIPLQFSDSTDPPRTLIMQVLHASTEDGHEGPTPRTCAAQPVQQTVRAAPIQMRVCILIPLVHRE